MPLFNLSNEHDYDRATEYFSSLCIEGKFIELKIASKQRTSRQNRSLHLMFTQLADQLNDAGKDLQTTLRADVSVAWTPELTKALLWKPVMKAVTGKDSTRLLTTVELDKVFEILSKHLGETLGLEIQFPSIESLIHQQMAEEN